MYPCADLVAARHVSAEQHTCTPLKYLNWVPRNGVDQRAIEPSACQACNVAMSKLKRRDLVRLTPKQSTCKLLLHALPWHREPNLIEVQWGGAGLGGAASPVRVALGCAALVHIFM